jgi:hypothetical protein
MIRPSGNHPEGHGSAQNDIPLGIAGLRFIGGGKILPVPKLCPCESVERWLPFVPGYIDAVFLEGLLFVFAVFACTG